MKKLLALVPTVLLMVSMFVGCGAQSETGDTTNSTAEAMNGDSNFIEADIEDEEVIAKEKSIEEKAKEAIETLIVWDGSVAESYAGGNGSIDNPYQIATAEQLAKLSYDTNNGVTFSGVYFELTNDIMLNDISYWNFDDIKANENISDYWINEWISIKDFDGSFDGNGYTVYGVYGIEDGIFEGASSILNLNCVCSYFNGESGTVATYWIGVIVDSVAKASISNCHVSNAVITNFNKDVGGICGFAEMSTIDDCSSESVYISNSDSTTNRIGGICGQVGYEVTISECYSSLKVGLSSVGNLKIGGICGDMGTDNNNTLYNDVEHCYSIVDIDVSGVTNAYYQDPAINIGGVIGYSENTTIENCGCYGEIVYNGDVISHIGGIVGEDVLGKKSMNGIALRFCYSDVTISTNDTNGTIGGIVGTMDCQATRASIEVTDCNYNNEYSSKGIGDASSSSFSNNIYGHTEEELRDISNYIDWDFDAIWTTDSSLNDGLPILRSQAKYFQN